MHLVFPKSILSRPLRFIHTSLVLNGEVNKQLLSKLRKTTGFPFINCSKALEKFGNDIKEAEKWLREEAQKEGWSKATKLQGRPMSEGLLGLSSSENYTALVEVNCETDFVARNSKFQNLVAVAAKALLDYGKSNNISRATLDQTELGNLIVKDKQISDLAALEVGNLGENILVRRGILIKPDSEHTLSYYIHSVGPKLHQSPPNCVLGKQGAMVVYQLGPLPTIPPRESKDRHLNRLELGRQLCQHIVGMTPKTLGNPDDKPGEDKDNESKFLHQEFIFEADVTINELMLQNNMNIIEFVSMVCGEELPARTVEDTIKVAEDSRS